MSGEDLQARARAVVDKWKAEAGVTTLTMPAESHLVQLAVALAEGEATREREAAKDLAEAAWLVQRLAFSDAEPENPYDDPSVPLPDDPRVPEPAQPEPPPTCPTCGALTQGFVPCMCPVPGPTPEAPDAQASPSAQEPWETYKKPITEAIRSLLPERPKEWWLDKAKAEEGYAVAAGHPGQTCGKCGRVFYLPLHAAECSHQLTDEGVNHAMGEPPSAQEPATPRIETGPLQIDDDWPGVFIRGDNAFGFAMALEAVLGFVKAKCDMQGGAWLYVAQCEGLLGDLRSSKVEGGKDPEGLQIIRRAPSAQSTEPPQTKVRIRTDHYGEDSEAE